MNNPINITQKGVGIFLEARRYKIYVLGGFGVTVGNFSIVLRNKVTNQKITCKSTI